MSKARSTVFKTLKEKKLIMNALTNLKEKELLRITFMRNKFVNHQSKVKPMKFKK